jgi:hypothetical protein
MGSEPSDQMMELLKELALLKQLDENGVGPKIDPAELESRRNRRREITEQIKALGGPVG